MEAHHFYMLQDCDVNERFLKTILIMAKIGESAD